jgi:hypothetical protein
MEQLVSMEVPGTLREMLLTAFIPTLGFTLLVDYGTLGTACTRRETHSHRFQEVQGLALETPQRHQVPSCLCPPVTPVRTGWSTTGQALIGRSRRITAQV